MPTLPLESENAAVKERAFLPSPELLPKPTQNHKTGGTLGNEGCSLPPASPFTPCQVVPAAHSHSKMGSNRGMARGLRGKKPVESFGGTCRVVSGRPRG